MSACKSRADKVRLDPDRMNAVIARVRLGGHASIQRLLGGYLRHGGGPSLQMLLDLLPVQRLVLF